MNRFYLQLLNLIFGTFFKGKKILKMLLEMLDKYYKKVYSFLKDSKNDHLKRDFEKAYSLN